MSTENSTRDGGILVSDFDGTMTRHDFYRLAIESLLPKDIPDYWSEYRRGTSTHFEALQKYFASIRVIEKDVLAVVDRMELDPGLPEAVNSLRRAGWKVVVVSAGCEWYIRRLLDKAGVEEVLVYANPGIFENGKGLLMRMPTDSAYLSHSLGVDKKKVVSTYLDAGEIVAFAGDGFPDADSARLVPSDLRFARGDLADELDSEGLEYQPFSSWSEIARALLERSA
jgi:2-hydroxy-3-keto-5-methylthiopentenyl-1-phosphate phosphatase